MKRLCTLLLAAGLLLAAFTGSASAEGFALYEWGARGNALGGSMVGRADDPSAVAFNPAGITQLEGTHVMGGFSAIIPSSTVEINHGARSYEGEGAFNIWVPPHGYMTTQLSDNMWLGMGIYTRFGLGSEYDDSSWGGRYNIYNVGIQTVSFNPNLAFKLTDDLSAAIGVEVMGLKLDMKKKINPTGKANNAPGNNPAGDIDSDLEADSYGVGLTAGLHYRLNDQWAAGVSYKSQVKHKARGTNDFSNVPAGPLQGVYADCDVNGVVILPDMISFGVVYYPTPEWSIEAGATLTRWSLYDNLPIYHSAPFYNGAGAMVNSEKEWNDAWRYNVGWNTRPPTGWTCVLATSMTCRPSMTTMWTTSSPRRTGNCTAPVWASTGIATPSTSRTPTSSPAKSSTRNAHRRASSRAIPRVAGRMYSASRWDTPSSLS